MFGLMRRLGTIVTVWGAVAACFAGISTPGQFYLLRFLLGAAEAGSFPGMWYVCFYRVLAPCSLAVACQEARGPRLAD